MDEEEKILPKEETPAQNGWQATKENWYDKVPLTLKQLDLIVWICWIALGVTAVLTALDAMDIFHLFG